MNPSNNDIIHVPISLGELIDKITILEIKNEFINDPLKLSHIQEELTLLQVLIPEHLKKSKELAQLHSDLKAINISIWKSEDGVRAANKTIPFDEKVYLEQTKNSHSMNEERFKAKQKINLLSGSYIQEQKSYD